MTLEEIRIKCEEAMGRHLIGGFVCLTDEKMRLNGIHQKIREFKAKAPIYSEYYRTALGKVFQLCEQFEDDTSTCRIHDPNPNRSISAAYFGVGGSPFPGLIGKGQYKYIGRALFRFTFPIHEDLPIVLTLGHADINRKRRQQMLHLTNNWYVRELINAFYNQNRAINWWHQYRQLKNNCYLTADVRVFTAELALYLYDAILYGFQKTLRPEWRTSTVMSLIRQMRKTEDFSPMPILADALQDADCNLDDLLIHLRNPEARYSLGGWLFRAAGVL